ncbi:uncharacterized protein C8Q71DRAFT_293293 [Rhodofomes roseus]|uniref:COQ9 C-terminal domain-containing protein n=1 Tax=Rhodofomes roseus TaxID=34475 RepID=A0ABQ8K3W0_9APHY|nr:uncharacterized protein C8Q71DRAFT_293293 [Rhodofomes roseus]KAH9831587.1 hypothetical protein C8Q71DRAFT_293293 [Rhodofomes roseus]
MSRPQLLQLAIPLVQTYGFTRAALSHSVFRLPKPHSEQLSDSAVTALFGEGNDARKTLIDAWLEDARQHMRASPSPTIKAILTQRLKQNEPVLQFLPEAFALLASPTNGLPPLDPLPALKHAGSVADEACHIVGEHNIGLAWYSRRATLGAVYAAAELHQLNSPSTVYDFLESLLDSSGKVESALQDAGTFAGYIGRSWAGIIKSRGPF